MAASDQLRAGPSPLRDSASAPQPRGWRWGIDQFEEIVASAAVVVVMVFVRRRAVRAPARDEGVTQ